MAVLERLELRVAVADDFVMLTVSLPVWDKLFDIDPLPEKETDALAL